MEKKRKMNTNKIVDMLYLFVSILFTIPSMIYLAQNKTIYHFTQLFTYTYANTNTIASDSINTILYLGFFFMLFFLYFTILKRVNIIFNSKKQLFLFIVMIGILFAIVIPSTSLDVYSYIGNGWVDSHYHENPYYTSVQDVTNEYGRDEMLGKVARCWREEPVVYGPVWSLICRGLTSFSFGHITLALYIFKLASLLMFLGSCILIDKITNKKFFVALFALNPFLLFESLSNVHNDIFLAFFMLLAIYFVKNRKNLTLATASIAVATGIKYLSILLLPFLICYGLKNETLKNKIKKTCLYAIEFIIVLLLFYMVYVRDLQVLSGIFVQQNKYGRSIFLALWYLLNGDEKVLALLKAIVLGIFIIAYISIIVKLFWNKQGKTITFRNTMKTYQVFLLIFTFVLITNFNPWYVIWLFPSLMWQKAKNIRTCLYLSLGVLNSYAITYATGIDDESVGIPYFAIMVLTVAILYVIHLLVKEIKKRKSIAKMEEK